MNIIVQFTTCFCPSAQTSVIEGLNTEAWLLPWLHSLATCIYQFRNRDSFIPYQSHYQAISVKYGSKPQGFAMWDQGLHGIPHVIIHYLKQLNLFTRTMYLMTKKQNKVIPLLWVMVWTNFRFMLNIEKVNTSSLMLQVSTFFFSILTKTTFLPLP